MAYDKIIALHRRMDHCINYVLNEGKTSLSYTLSYAENPEKSHRLVTGINCEVETAFVEMQATKQRWDKRGGVLGYHIIHSYAPGEVTPEEAHAAGVEFAQRLLGERYEVVVSTHLDREHLHCHIVFNSVSFVDGKKYRSDFKSYFKKLRGTSNEVSAEYGLSVIEPEGHGKHYAEWNAEQRGKSTLRDLVRQDIDAAIADAFTFESFLAVLHRRGYTVKYGANVKHTAICPPGGKRFFRLDGLGAGYIEADIRVKLAASRSGGVLVQTMTVVPTLKRYAVRKRPALGERKQSRGFRALYLYYLYLLGKKRWTRKHIPHFTVRKEVTKLRRYQQQFRLLQEYCIDDDHQLALLGEALQTEIDALVGQRKDLYNTKRGGEDVTEKLEAIHRTLRQLRRKLKTCVQIEADIPLMRSHMQVEWERQRQSKQVETDKRRLDRRGKRH